MLAFIIKVKCSVGLIYHKWKEYLWSGSPQSATSRISGRVNKHPRVTCKDLVDLQVSGTTVIPETACITLYHHFLQSTKYTISENFMHTSISGLCSRVFKLGTYWNYILWFDEAKLVIWPQLTSSLGKEFKPDWFMKMAM